MNFNQWAIKWGVPMVAIKELESEVVGLCGTPGDEDYAGKKSEAFADSQVVLEASQKGVHLWRNNVGALKDDRGVPVRYGLANTSSKLNKVLKSSDRIGIRPRVILPQDVGHIIGQFIAREIKEPGWHYTGTEREVAQLNFITLINAAGGDASFATGIGTI
jgi:hypothetical protein